MVCALLLRHWPGAYTQREVDSVQARRGECGKHGGHMQIGDFIYVNDATKPHTQWMVCSIRFPIFNSLTTQGVIS